MKKIQLCSVVPAHRHMQYLGELVFFQTPLILQGCVKKKQIHLNIALDGVQERQNQNIPWIK